MNVYRYICPNCHHWWSTNAPAEYCPACKSELISRVYLESEEAAMLAALGALTFERDEARESAKQWHDLWRKMNDLRIRATKERDDARRWARHFYRLWKELQPVSPFSSDVALFDNVPTNAEQIQSVVKAFGVDLSKWQPSPSNEMVEKARAAGIPTGLYRHNSDTGKDEIIEYPTVASKGRKAKRPK